MDQDNADVPFGRLGEVIFFGEVDSMLEVCIGWSIIVDEINGVLVGLMCDIVGADAGVGIGNVPGWELDFGIVAEYPDETKDT